jgi:tRNA/rRNA methyltransferase
MRVVNPYDPAFREAKSALRGRNVLAEAEVFTSVAEAVADCSLVVGTTAVGKRHLHHPLKRLEEGGKLIRKRLGGNSRTKNCVAILFGSEKRGLSNADLSHCHWLMRIPTEDKSASMNLGQAVAVCLYELARDAKATAGAEKIEFASAEVVERFTEMLSEALSVSGFFEIRKVIDLEDRMRRLVRRLNLPAKDADMWLGMMRQIVWGLKNRGR